MNGQIVKILSNTYFVSDEKNIYECTCRGKFRHQNITPLVGDYVLFNEQEKVIDEIKPRKNAFIRPAVANIDQAFIITSVKDPNFSSNLLDKLICLMELNHIHPIIIKTKEDLLTSKEKKELAPIFQYYQSLGYQVISNQDLKAIKKMIQSHLSVFTGQTGAGKSTLLNRLNIKLNLQTGETSKALGRGRHTTRHVEIVEVENGRVLDTPGFSALDFENVEKKDIQKGFIEIDQVKCPYQDCMHLHEEECIVKELVNLGKILDSRYLTYQKLMLEQEVKPCKYPRHS